MGTSNQYYTYILLCGDGTLYTGYAADVRRRIQSHNEGCGAKYTRGRLPVKLQYAERCESRAAALSREARIKQLSREQKLQLIRTWDGTL